MKSTTHEVVITGMGAVLPFGQNIETVFESLCQGQNGTNRIDNFEGIELRRKNAVQIKYEIECLPKWLNYSRVTQMSLSAVNSALIQSKLDIGDPLKNIGISFGTALGAIPEIQKRYIDMHLQNEKMESSFLNEFCYNTIPEVIAKEFTINGICNTVGVDCASGSVGVGVGYKWIKYGRTDAVICGGVDVFNILGHLIMSSMRLISNNQTKPFNTKQSGFIFGEGAAVVILEEKEKAINRGAPIFAEVLGYSSTCDAIDVNKPDENGNGLNLAMTNAINEANLSVEEIDYINAHGVGTTTDFTEISAIKKTFERRRKPLYISSIKGALGHMSGASGVVDLIFTILSIIQSRIPPTLHYESKNEDFIWISDKEIRTHIYYALSNTLAFGGINSSIVIGKN
jgi:3-oxoacyl-[acyl-carrier-protein] synthase II